MSAKPGPNIDADIQPFWTAASEERFVLMRCDRCGEHYWPAAYCRHHENEPFFGNMSWVEASGRGTVFAYNIHHRAFHPGFSEDLPYVYALVELDEGPMYGCNIVDVEPAEVYIGMPVRVTFEDRGGGVKVPQFRPDR